MNFREHLFQLDPNLIVESSGEELSQDEIMKEIEGLLGDMTDEEIDEFGAFLSVEFFDTPEEDIEELYFDLDAVIDMIDELGSDDDEEYNSEIYSIILDLLLPDDFKTTSDYIDDFEDAEDSEEGDDTEVSEGVSRIMRAKNLNRKQRKFYKKSAATLRKERAVRVKQNRMNRADKRAYTRVNKAKLKSYQKSRARFIKKGKHFVKVRRQAGE